ncbi:tetratricopeptide repeat protein [Candidatus Methanocrinis natronophilus]|uniref:Tetratricopeptide repeat protein n=1 Tax=Candidatus Methanocrinis natronophilus TaxID=3033396 RepID=A0ABT5X5R6_9EURY|nr:tetratricopeptide repeat protein [Candidatus Methanocrinis natronophilus]MDF0590042.1 tetratricopeptide repeat protein [Candidatus Methanocrinis natronophilus]
MKDFFLQQSRNPDFTGREPLLMGLKSALDGGGTAVLLGADGMGKSATAAEYARVNAGEYDFIFWMRSWNDTVLALDFASLAAPLGIPHQEDTDLLDLGDAVRAWMEVNSRWLLIFDDAPSPSALEVHLPQAGSGGGGVIITSSSRKSWMGGEAASFEIGPLEPSQAVAFLFRRTGQEDPAASMRLAKLLEGFPLALEVAAGYIRWTGISLSRYVDLYERRLSEISGKTAPSIPITLAAVLYISMEQVRAVSVEGSEILSLSAFLAPEDLPFELLVGAGSLLTGSVDLGLVALERRGLLRRDGASPSVHPLIQAFAFGALDFEGRKAWAEETVRAVGGAFSPLLEDLSRWPDCGRLLPHALASTGKLEDLGSGSEEASLLLNQAGLYLQRRGDLMGARSVLERLVAVDEGLRGPQHPEVATDLNNLGSVLRVLGDLPGAMAHFERAIAIEEAQDEPDPLKIAIRANNLGTVLRSLGDLPGALAQYERALSIDMDAYGPNHFKTAIRINNLGEVLREMGDLDGAMESFNLALRVFGQFLGPGHHYTERARENLESLGEGGKE